MVDAGWIIAEAERKVGVLDRDKGAWAPTTQHPPAQRMRSEPTSEYLRWTENR